MILFIIENIYQENWLLGALALYKPSKQVESLS